MAEKGLNCGINKISIMVMKITVPDIGDFENVEIIEILTKLGAVIKKNDPIATLESDKSSVEVPSPFAGKISSLNVKIGDKVSKGSVLAIIEEAKSENSEKIEKSKKEKQKNIEPLVLKEEEESGFEDFEDFGLQRGPRCKFPRFLENCEGEGHRAVHTLGGGVRPRAGRYEL